jgi:hypothetical protein
MEKKDYNDVIDAMIVFLMGSIDTRNVSRYFFLKNVENVVLKKNLFLIERRECSGMSGRVAGDRRCRRRHTFATIRTIIGAWRCVVGGDVES